MHLIQINDATVCETKLRSVAFSPVRCIVSLGPGAGVHGAEFSQKGLISTSRGKETQ